MTKMSINNKFFTIPFVNIISEKFKPIGQYVKLQISFYNS